MKTFFSIAFAFIALSLVAISQPKMEIIGGVEHNWGKVKPSDSPLKHTIKIKNSGNEQLVIRNVKPSCGCTTAPLDKDKLQPGETANIDVKMNIGNRAGKTLKTITISSNDPKNSMVVYKLNADVKKSITIEPVRYFAFNQMEVGKEESASVTIKNTGDEAVTISDFSVKPDDLKINLKGKKTLKPGESVKLTAKITPTKPGYLNCNVSFVTTSKEDPKVSISGYGSVKESPIFNNK